MDIYLLTNHLLDDLYYTNLILNNNDDEVHYLPIKIGKAKKVLISKSSIFRIRSSC